MHNVYLACPLAIWKLYKMTFSTFSLYLWMIKNGAIKKKINFGSLADTVVKIAVLRKVEYLQIWHLIKGIIS